MKHAYYRYDKKEMKFSGKIFTIVMQKAKYI